MIQWIHSVLPFFVRRREPTGQSNLVVRLLAEVFHPFCFQDTARMLWAHLAGLNRAQQLPASPLLARSLSIHGMMMSMLGWQSRGKRFGDYAVTIARDFDDIWAQGNSCSYTGIGDYAGARFENGLSQLTQAIRLFESAGDQWEVHITRFHKGCCHFGLGDLADAVAEAKWVFESSARLGDSRTMCSSWLWARATRGDIPFDQLKSCIPCRPDDVMSSVHAILAEGYWNSFHERSREALECYERAADTVWKTRCVNSHMILVLPMLVQGLRLRADAVEAENPRQARRLRNRARKRSRLATRLTWLFPAAYPLALRERALILDACGRTRKALKLADKSCRVAEAQKAKYEHAQSLLVRGRLAKKLGRREADEQLHTAEAAIEEIEAPVRAIVAAGLAIQSRSYRSARNIDQWRSGSTHMHEQDELDRLVDQWQSAAALGEAIAPEELCADRPELLASLEERIEVLRKFGQLAASRTGSSPSNRNDRDATGDYEPVDVDSGSNRSSFDSVLSTCSAFAEEWQHGSNPSIRNYLDRVAPDSRPPLLRNLLAIELEHRRERGEQPTLDEYLAQFPEFAPLVRGLFLEVSSVSIAAGGDTPGGPAPALPAPAASRIADYQLVRELGRGGMGIVFEAIHSQRGTRVALKTLPAVDGPALHRFKREFRSMAEFNHPNLIGLHTLESDGCHWFFTMDLVEGTDFLRFVRPGQELNEGRLRLALGQLITGVMALHARHVVHRDLKPSNVIVSHEGRVILLDFGLVAELDTPTVSRSLDKVAGTPRYMAPEQAAGEHITPAADWYAVGVMLYEALCGKSPFAGRMWRILQDKQTHDAPPLPDRAEIPKDLAELSMRLLARDPALRPNPLEIARLVSTSAPNASPAAGGASHALVGREQQLSVLRDVARRFERDREPVTVFISGRSGEGKTALADHFLSSLREDGRLAIMSGRCYDRESVPFKALDSLIDALTSHLRGLPEKDAALVIPDDVRILAQVFPVLQRVGVIAESGLDRVTGLDEQQVRQRAFRALRALLDRLSRRTPIVWFVDDLQWGDADSATALFEVLRPPEAPALLFVGTYRSDEQAGSAFLRSWKDLQAKNDVQFSDTEVRVGPLGEADCVQLAIDLLGRDTDAIRRRAAEFARETGGNAFLLTELIGCFDPDTDSFEPVPLDEVIRRKLGRLPAEAGPLLDVVAVSGQALSLDEAARTADYAESAVATVTRMRNERLVRLVGPDESPLVDTYHDRVRETVLRHMDEGKCQALHATLAQVIEVDAGGGPESVDALVDQPGDPGTKALPRVYDLAYHFDAAGDRKKGCVYALLAAEQARRQSALEVAIANFEVADRNAEGASDAARLRIAQGFGEALMQAGKYAEAETRLQAIVDRVEDPVRKAEIELLLGRVAFYQGGMAASAAVLERGLRRLGYWVPRTLFGFGVGIVRETVVQGLHTLLPFFLHRKEPTRERVLAVEFLLRMSESYIFQSTIKLLWDHLANLNRAEQLPNSSALSKTYAAHTCIIAMLGWSSRGSRYGARATALAHDFDDVLGQGLAHYFYGIGLYAAAIYEKGLAELTESIQSLGKAGDPYGVHLAHFHKGCCHLGLGQLADAVAEARLTFTSAARIGDSRTMCSSWLWARATGGNFPFDRLKGLIPCRPDDVMSTVHAILAEGYWHSFHGRTKEALECYERAADMAWSSRCINSHTILVLPMLVSGLRVRANAREQNDPREARRLRNHARTRARLATRLTWLFPAAYPLALRERSLILDAVGKTRKALKLAEKSCRVAEAQNAKYEHAQSLLVRGRLAKKLGRPEADQQIRDAETAIEEMERPVREAATVT